MLRKLFRRWSSKTKGSSSIEAIIPPEIKDDAFYTAILDLASKVEARHILEIGSSSGRGSTEAFALGIARNPSRPHLHCMEISKTRFAALKAHYAGNPQVFVYNASSVPASELPTAEQVSDFYRTHPTKLNEYPLEQVLSWLEADRTYMGASPLPDGIRHILAETGVDHFDVVLIDGSEFTGEPELDLVYGARWILLDDVNAHKNFMNHRRLSGDPSYRLVEEDWGIRHGYAIFERT
ncbi:hypothetical protein GETHLI_10130 [Geothrix limicola]|uniref:Class I SAM-dependent methyltransferase n=1 Tax=Geothrix limicola TaxID=2927978 RepID=A0ABQ5QDF2_9BACT|nr:hypothetical protein [Geothrix limicola]GLH72511.1 hypothetical protein GETHLI_10130 [Geothrix limicola]